MFYRAFETSNSLFSDLMDSLDFILYHSFREVHSQSAGILYNDSLSKQLHNKKRSVLNYLRDDYECTSGFFLYTDNVHTGGLVQLVSGWFNETVGFSGVNTGMRRC